MRLKLCKPYINGFRNVDCTSCLYHPRILQWVGTRVSTPNFDPQISGIIQEKMSRNAFKVMQTIYTRI